MGINLIALPALFFTTKGGTTRVISEKFAANLKN
jgi:hypothetical protein